MAKKEETIKVSDERKKALEMAIEKIEKDFGKGSIMCLGEKAGVNVESISTGALPLDMADRKSTRLNSSHRVKSRMPSSA